MERVRKAISEKISASVQAELVDYLKDYTDLDYAAFPVYDGLKKDKGKAVGKMAGNLLKGMAEAAISSSGTNSTGLADDLGEFNVGFVFLNLKTGLFDSYYMLPAEGLGAGSEKMNREICNFYQRSLKTMLKEVQRHNEKAAKELAKIQAKEAKQAAKEDK